MALGVTLALMWFVEILDQLADLDLDRHGIEPREVEGLDGVLLSPFLHADFGHLIGNTVPYLVLGGLIALSGFTTLATVFGVVMVVGGVGTWLVAPAATVHIGASGIVFGFAAFLVARGILSRSMLHLLGGALVLAVWGTTLLRGVVPEEGISWQGHLFGAIGGVVAARLLAKPTHQHH